MTSDFQPRFGQAVAAYRTFRPPYPDELFERILQEIPPDRRSLAVDLGAGTGLSALPLCQWFAQVIAVEPDPQMAAHIGGQRPNVVVRRCTAENCRLDPASVDLVTCATSFHWMDASRTLANILFWLRLGGVLAVCWAGFPRTPPPVQAILDREMSEHWDAFRHERLRDAGYTERTIRAFPGFEVSPVVAVPHFLHVDPKQLAGFCSSTSYASAYLRTLPNPDTYRCNLEEALRHAAGDASILTDLSLELLLARKA